MSRKRKQSKVPWPSQKRRKRRRVGEQKTTTTSTHTEGSTILNVLGGAAGLEAAGYVGAPVIQAATQTLVNYSANSVAAIIGVGDVGLLASGALATPIAPLLGAVALGAAGIAAGVAVADMFTRKTITTSSTKLNPIMSSTYAGRVAQKGKSDITIRNKYQKLGAVVIAETAGFVSDPDMIGVGHITFNIEAVIKSIHHALLRKLFRKLGLHIETPYQDLSLGQGFISGPNCLKIVTQMLDVNGTVTTGEIILPANTTLENLYALPGGVAPWTGDSLAGTLSNMVLGSNPPILKRIFLYIVTPVGVPGSITTVDRLGCMLNMPAEKIEICVNAHTVIQNRTKSTSGSLGTDVIDAQPLKGPVFQFSGIPKTKMVGVYPLNGPVVNGVYLFRKTELGAADGAAWAEPPVRKAFTNVLKAGYVRIAPGLLNDMSASKSWGGYFETVIMKWRVAAEYGSVNLMQYSPGMAQILFLEEEMNSGSSNYIIVNYETQHTVGCNFTTSSSPNMQPVYSASVLNNFPPP